MRCTGFPEIGLTPSPVIDKSALLVEADRARVVGVDMSSRPVGESRVATAMSAPPTPDRPISGATTI